MRTISTSMQKLLSAGERSTSFVVEIDRTGSGDWVNLRSHENLDWIHSVEWENNAQNPVDTATVRLKRQFDDLSLSPLMAQSKLNASSTLIWPKRKIRIRSTDLDRGNLVSSGGDVVFDGKIDKIQWNRDPIEISCRDLGGDLQDAFIETQAIYGSDAGRDIEDVIQDILDDANTNGWLATAVTLHTPTTPGFAIRKYKQGKESVMSAIQKLARLIGYQCKYKWRSGTSQFELTLYSPTREVRARGSLTLTGLPTATETFVVNSTTFTARASGATTDEFNIGATALATCTNIAAMLNSDSESSNVNAWVDNSGANPKVVIEWQVPGTVGDAVTFTEALSNATADGSGTLGGTQSGADITEDFTFSPSQYWEPDTLSIDVQNVRNAFSLTYKAPDDSQTRTTVTRKNSASIAKYGRRFFGMTEGPQSQIDTVEEAQDMLAAADYDCSEPDADLSIPVVYFPWGEPGDYYKYQANGIHFDSDQSFAAISLRHMGAEDRLRTMIMARGKPSLGYRRWLEIEGRPGVAPGVDLFNDTPGTTTGESLIGGIAVSFDDPRTQDPAIEDWAYTEVYVSTSSITEPDNGERPSAGLLKAKGRQTRFEILGLKPGVTYYIRIFHIDSAGNVSSSATEISTAAAYKGPVHQNPDTLVGSLIPNSEFGVWSPPEDDKASFPPDFWTCIYSDFGTGGDWADFTEDDAIWGTGNDNIYYDETYHQTGATSIRIKTTNSTSDYNGIRTRDFIPVVGGRLYGFEFAVLAEATTAGYKYAVRWYEEDKSTVAGDDSQSWAFTTIGTYTWFTRFVDLVAPDAARYMKVSVIGEYNASVETVYVDRFQARRLPPSFYVYQNSTSGSRTQNVWAYITMDTELHDYGDFFNLTGVNDYFEVPWDAVYQFSACVTMGSIEDAHFVQLALYIDSGSGYAVVAEGSKHYNSSGGTDDIAAMIAVQAIDLQEGDKVRLYVYFSGTGTKSPVAGAEKTYFCGRLVEALQI